MRASSPLTRWLRRSLAVAAVALTTVLGVSDMSAETPPKRDTGFGTPSKAEEEAYELVRNDKPLSARTQAEEILKNDPDSLIGHFVMGVVMRDAEGSLPRAMAHFKKARELYERRYGNSDGDGRPWRIYAQTLLAMAHTAGLMEDFETELRGFDEYDARFTPKQLAQRVWPLMKLGRYDDARAWAKAAIATGSPYQKLRAMNGLCAVEAEEGKRAANYDACLAVYRYAKDLQKDSDKTGIQPELPVYATNAHLAALSMLKYDEAEQLAIDGTKNPTQTASNPWLRLARIYVDQGRAAEAVSATKALQAWRGRQPPSTRDQFAAEDESTVAILLLAAGEPDYALKLADRILSRPDRRAMTSTDANSTAGANALLRRATLKLGAELEKERASTSSLGEAIRHRSEAARLSALAWPDAQRAVGVLMDETCLESTLRIYMDNGLDYVPTWLLGDLVEVIGPGVFLAALGRARDAENEVAGYAAFYDGLEAEARLAQGNTALSLDLARKALDALPKAEALFKARVAAVGAVAATREGDDKSALSFFERAMLADPGVVRRMGLKLPARFEARGGELAKATIDLLQGSPRLSESDGGFVVSVTADAATIRSCIHTPLGAELGCGLVPVSPPPPVTAPYRAGAAPASSSKTAFGEAPGEKETKPPPPPRPPEERAAEAFHKAVFALKMNLSESDLRSLDGGTTATRDATRQKMREIIGEEPEGED